MHNQSLSVHLSLVVSLLRKPICQWNNQNWELTNCLLILPVYVDGKVQQLFIACSGLVYTGKPGILRVKKKRGKWIADITLTQDEVLPTDGQAVMGIDLGLKVPAVTYVGGKGTRFFGNGRYQRHMRRRFYARRKKLQKAKKTRAVKKSKGKERRWMKDINHKLSRQIVNHAHAQGVGTIKIESLHGIRKGTTRTSRGAKARKNNRMKNSWSFYQLSQFIAYKAERLGIRIYVDKSLHPLKQRDSIVEAAGSYNAALDLIHTALRAESEGERYTGVLGRLALAFALRV
jgi:putative transposase